MENSTKVLLISAVVLIAIILISVGINVMISTRGIEEEQVVGNEISNKLSETSEHIIVSTDKIEHFFYGTSGNAGTSGNTGTNVTGETNTQTGVNNEVIIEQLDKVKDRPIVQGENWYIYTVNQFKFFADFVNNDLPETDRIGYPEITSTTNIFLENDLNLKNIEWTPIGKDNNNIFIGTFDGKGHEISELKVNVQNCAGLFGYANNTIKNVIIKNSTIEGQRDYIGAIAGIGKNIENCKSENNIIKGTQYVGGIIGHSISGGVIKNCINTSKVSSLPDDNIKDAYINEKTSVNRLEEYGTHTGGILGKVAGETVVSYCVNRGKIESNYSRIGGIAGDTAVSNIIITNCINEGEITLVNQGAYVGGIVGIIPTDGKDPSGNITESNRPKVLYCYNTGKITGGSGVGGIVGCFAQYLSLIDRCYNAGNINGKSSTGGLVGSLGRSSQIKNCYNTGNVKGNSQIGGILGRPYGTFNKDGMLINCYNIGNVEGTTSIAEIVGASSSTYKLINCMEKNENIKASFIKDNNIWEIRSGENNGYPVLTGIK